MKTRTRIELDKHGFTKVTEGKGGAILIEPMSWPNLREYFKWLLDNFDRLPFKFSSRQVKCKSKQRLKEIYENSLR